MLGLGNGPALILEIAKQSELRLDAARALAALIWTAPTGASLGEESGHRNDQLVKDGLLWILILAKQSDATSDALLVARALSTLCQEKAYQQHLLATTTDYDRFGGYDSAIATLIGLEKRASKVHGGAELDVRKCEEVKRACFQCLRELSKHTAHLSRLKDEGVHLLCEKRLASGDASGDDVLQLARQVLRMIDPTSIVAVDDIRLPEYWAPFPNAARAHCEVEVGRNTPEYRMVSTMMAANIHQHGGRYGRVPKTGADPVAFPIKRIVRIQDKNLWRDYQHKKDSLVAKYGDALQHSAANEWLRGRPILTARSQDVANLDKRVNELYLFHGTKEATADILKTTGFDNRVASLVGMFGGGSYFAENSSKSNQYIPGPEQGCDNPYQMLLCRVLLGDIHICKHYDQEKYRGTESGHHYVRRPPQKPNSFDVFDSVMGEKQQYGASAKKFRPLQYREFIVYEQAMAYPEYQVYFHRE